MIGHPLMRVAGAALGFCCWLGGLSMASGADPSSAARPASIAEAQKLAKRIDQIILKRLKAERIKPAPAAKDAVWLRRLHLDLAGRIPTLLELRDFLDDDRPDKRLRWVERLLESDDYSRHFANVWRSILIPHRTNADGYFLPTGEFETWLQEHFKNNDGFDTLARNLLTNQGQSRGSPQLFFTANGQEPEEMTAITSRVFLGVHLDCAQCHAHPFDKWTREQFWSMAVFFPSNNKSVSVGNKRALPTITIPGTKRVVEAKFLDGKQPPAFSGSEGRQVLADWITTKDNPFFARAIADHTWNYFFGVSLLETIREEESPTHAELLNALARELADRDFDLKYLIRAIVFSEAYQRSSRTAPDDSDKMDIAVRLFARMPVRSLRPEQLLDSFLIATENKKPTYAPVTSRYALLGDTLPPHQEFLIKFADQGSQTEKQTSIMQALYLMNGSFLAERLKPSRNDTLRILAHQPTSHERRLESLYLLVLSRRPYAGEVQRLVPYLERGGATDNLGDALADVYWALLNSSEFLLNH